MAHAGDASPYDAVVFAGGGCRCFWQAGFWSVAAPALDIAPNVVAAVSAGSAFACASIAGVATQVLEDFKRRTRANERNLYMTNLLRGRRVFPHEGMYRATILASLNDEVLDRLRTGPDIRIVIARPPARLGPRSGLAFAALAQYLDTRRGVPVHAEWASRLGFRSEVVSVRTCRTPVELADLILHSSCMWPIVPLYRRGATIVLDGGLIDNAPADIVREARSTLVLLTRRFPPEALPRVAGRTYLMPSRAIPIVNWDYTSPDLVQQTYDLGRRDGEAFVRRETERTGV